VTAPAAAPTAPASDLGTPPHRPGEPGQIAWQRWSPAPPLQTSP